MPPKSQRMFFPVLHFKHLLFCQPTFSSQHSEKKNQLPNNTTCNTSRGCVFSQKTLSLPGVPIVCTHAPPYAEQ